MQCIFEIWWLTWTLFRLCARITCDQSSHPWPHFLHEVINQNRHGLWRCRCVKLVAIHELRKQLEVATVQCTIPNDAAHFHLQEWESISFVFFPSSVFWMHVNQTKQLHAGHHQLQPTWTHLDVARVHKLVLIFKWSATDNQRTCCGNDLAMDTCQQKACTSQNKKFPVTTRPLCDRSQAKANLVIGYAGPRTSTCACHHHVLWSFQNCDSKENVRKVGLPVLSSTYW